MKTISNQELLQLQWHDAIIHSVEVDRTNPGINDNIAVSIEWPDESRCKLIFCECYAANLSLNFGIIAQESILDMNISEESDGINKIKSLWGKIGVSVGEVFEYHIETNSTNSHIYVYCRYVCVP